MSVYSSPTFSPKNRNLQIQSRLLSCLRNLSITHLSYTIKPMHSLLNPIKPTFLPLLLLTTLTNAYQVHPRQISSNNAITLSCDARNLRETNLEPTFPFNITSNCTTQFQTTCSSSPGGISIVKVPSLYSNQLEVSQQSLCGQDFSSSLPKLTAAICYCACQCTDEIVDQEAQRLHQEDKCAAEGQNPYSCTGVVQSMSVSSAASVSTTAWSNYTATVTGSALATSSTGVRALGPQEGFERKRRM